MSRRENAESIEVVVGLGNPGRQYEGTRHNAGFLVLDRLADALGIVLQERRFKASWGTGNVEGRKLLLIKPLSFMNLSGEPVGQIVRYFSIPPDRILVVHDDLDLPLGRIRVAQHGGPGGHRGIVSLIQHLGGQDFPRLKLGIGRPAHGEPVEAYVLDPPYPGDRDAFHQMVERGFEVARAILSDGLVPAMNRYNRRDPEPEGQNPSRRSPQIHVNAGFLPGFPRSFLRPSRHVSAKNMAITPGLSYH